MYCSQCGAKADGDFCFQCGAPLQGATRSSVEQTDWSEQINYEELLRVREVRDLIAEHASMARERPSVEELLSICDNALSPVKGLSSKTVVAIAQPILAGMGIKTGKTRSQVFQRPAGRILVASLCCLARQGWPLRHAKQAVDGCVLEATLPSDVWAMKANLVVSVSRTGSGTLVEVATTVPGQLYDWGKSNRCLGQLFADLSAVPAILKRDAG